MTPPDSGEREVVGPAQMDAPGGPRCWCGKPSRTWDGWCGVLHPREVSLPLPLAQRILAALEECGEVVGPGIIFPRHTALADELRAIVGRKP